MITDQEYFDKTITHLATQGHRAMGGIVLNEAVCAYRGNNGDKCAAGIHIPDDKYEQKMENLRISNVITYYHLEEYFPNRMLASILQRAHDVEENWTNPETMITVLRNIAVSFNLNTDVLYSLDFSNIRA